MKKALSCSLAFFLIVVSALVFIPANAGLGGSTYRVFYISEQAVGDQNADMDDDDNLVVLYKNSDGTFKYIGEGIEPEISGELIMWHNEDHTKLYIFHATASPVWQPYWFRDYYQDAELHGDGIAFNSYEYKIGEYVNGDSDMSDNIVGYMDLHNFPSTPPDPEYWTGYKTPRGGFDGDTIFYVKYESQETDNGYDYIADGDKDDTIIHYVEIVNYEPGSEQHPSYPVSGYGSGCGPGNVYMQGTYPRVGEDAVWTSSEAEDECDWDGDFLFDKYVTVGFEMTGGATKWIDWNTADHEGYHYVDESLVAYRKVASDPDAGPQTRFYVVNTGNNGPVYLGTPIKVVGSCIIGYLNEEDLEVNLDGDAGGISADDNAMWIYDTDTGKLEILEGGNKYWK